MDQPRGRIVEVFADADPPYAIVEVTASLRCARCAAGKGCGAGLLGGDERARRVAARIESHPGLQVGDRVEIALRPDDLLAASLYAWGFPLLTALLAAGGAYLAGLGDLWAALATLAGLAAGAAFGRRTLRRTRCLQRFTPVVAGRLHAA